MDSDSSNLIGITLFLFLLIYFLICNFVLVEVDKIKGSFKQQIISNRKMFLGMCQSFIIIISMVIGFIGEKLITKKVLNLLTLNNEFSHLISLLFSIILIFLVIIISNMALKWISIYNIERVAILFVKPLILISKLIFPLFQLFNFADNKKINVNIYNSLQELDLINDSDILLKFNDKKIRDIMIHRKDMACVCEEKSVEDNLKIIEKGYSFYPYIQHDKDNVLGIINIQKLFVNNVKTKEVNFKDYLEPTFRVLDSISITSLFEKMQRENLKIVILMDEYGGTSGLITVNDIIKEINNLKTMI